jgi:hypothetical protein
MTAIDERHQLNRLGRPKSISASSAARIVRPVNSTSSTSRMTRSSIENGISVRRITGCGPTAWIIRVVAVERDVECPDRHLELRQVLEVTCDARRQRHAARANADERQIFDAEGGVPGRRYGEYFVRVSRERFG